MKRTIRILILILSAMHFAPTQAQVPVFKRAGQADAPAAPAPAAPSPAAPATPPQAKEVKPLPACGSGFSRDASEIDKALQDTTGFMHGFNKDYELGEERVERGAQCRSLIQNGEHGPQIVVYNCLTLQTSIGTRVVKACQAGPSRIRFVEVKSKSTGFLGTFEPDPQVIEFAKESEGRWRVFHAEIPKGAVVIEIPLNGGTVRR